MSKVGISPTAAAAAIGLIEGNPYYTAIMERRPTALDEIKTAVARNLTAVFGDQPLRFPLRAFVFSAHRP